MGLVSLGFSCYTAGGKLAVELYNRYLVISGLRLVYAVLYPVTRRLMQMHHLVDRWSINIPMPAQRHAYRGGIFWFRVSADGNTGGEVQLFGAP